MAVRGTQRKGVKSGVETGVIGATAEESQRPPETEEAGSRFSPRERRAHSRHLDFDPVRLMLNLYERREL